MRKIVFTIALIGGLQASLNGLAQETQVTLHVQTSVRPLAERWVSEYTQNHPQVAFQIVNGKANSGEHPVSLVTEQSAADGQSANTVFFARYAVLPVVNRESEAERLLSGKHLNAKRLRSLFFVKDEWEEDVKDGKAEQTLHVITGNSQHSASRTWASGLKQEVVNYKGKKISGDDAFLNVALSRDPLAVTVNSLSNLFDLRSRRLRSNLSLVPLDIDKRGKQVLGAADLDAIILLLEQQQFTEIPVGRLGLEYNHHDNLLADFVQWILTEGQRYAHEYGLLQLSQKELAVQQHRAEQEALAQK